MRVEHRTAIISTLFVILWLLAAGEARAQGIYLDTGQSATGGGIGLATHDDYTKLSLHAGYSHQARVDVGLSLNHYSLRDDNPFSPDVSVWGIEPNLNVHLLRQGEGFPLSVMATASMQRIFYVSDDLDRLNIHFKTWIYATSAGVYRSLALDRDMELIPHVMLGRTWRTTTTETVVGTFKDDDDTTDLVLTAHIVFRTASAAWTIAPQLAVIDGDEVTFGVFLGGAFF